jgi:hypothetical protein
MLIVFTFQVQSASSATQAFLFELIAQGKVEDLPGLVIEHKFILALPQVECLQGTEMLL